MDQSLLRPWLHGAMVACGICMVVLVIVSLLTKPTPDDRLAVTTFDFGSIGSAASAPDGTGEAASVSLLHDYRTWLIGSFIIVSGLWWFMR